MQSSLLSTCSVILDVIITNVVIPVTIPGAVITDVVITDIVATGAPHIGARCLRLLKPSPDSAVSVGGGKVEALEKVAPGVWGSGCWDQWGISADPRPTDIQS
jgi:hypothetical protein